MLKRLTCFTHIQQWIALYVIVIMVFGLILTDSAFAYDRKVLFEDFTSTTCPPCGSSAPALEAALQATSDIVVPIAIHVWWPGDTDPWWRDNQNDNRTRVQYYGVNSVPWYVVDGVRYTDSRTTQAIQNAIEQAARDNSPLEIDLFGAIDGEDLTIGVEITAEEDLSNVILYVALTEDHVEYNGVNAYDDHYDPMVKMYPDGNGTSFSIDADETREFSFEGSMRDIGWHELVEDNLLLVCWVQASNHEVHQAQTSSFFWDTPRVMMTEWSISDEAEGNGDGRAEGGETIDMTVTMELPQQAVDAESCIVTLTCDDEEVNIIEDTFDIGQFESGSEIENSASPFIFSVEEGFEPHPVTFNLTVNAQPNNYEQDYEITFMIGWPYILLIDASAQEAAAEAMTGIFGTGDLPYIDYFDITSEYGIPEGLLDHYDAVIWHTFNNPEVIWIDFEFETLTDYLENGGTLIISSSFICLEFGRGNFFRDFLAAELVVEEEIPARRYVYGYDVDDNFASTNLFLGGGDGAGFPAETPILNAVGEGVPVLYYHVEGEDLGITGVKHETETYKTLVLSFPIESIGGIARTEYRDEFVMRIWNWINGETDAPVDVNIQPVEFSLDPVYPNPFNSSSVIPFNLDKKGQVTLSVFDLTGREVVKLINDVLPSGRHQAVLDAAAQDLTTGLYYVKLTGSGHSAVRKMIYMR
ncbi:Omp28-related outer membrane protein [bacterium]|nr:Omp28-related outer membrane protein [bacterium]